MSCETFPSEDICPVKAQIIPQLLALAPRGRAHGNHDGLPQPDTLIFQFWSAVASVWEYVNQRICALALEFFCASIVETRPAWLVEYGLPDACDPYPDLCAKVAAIGGRGCAYYAAMAQRAGWAVTCVSNSSSCGSFAGRAQAGCGQAGGLAAGIIIINVSLSSSPAYARGAFTPSLAGRMQSGMTLSCGPNIGPLQCLLARIIPGHLQVIYQAIA